MNIDKLIGSASIRAGTLAALLVSGTAWALHDYVVAAAEVREALFFLAIVAGVLAFIALVHSFRILFVWWLRVAKRLHQLVVTLLFGSCYLIIVPLFLLILHFVGLLRLRRRSQQTFWVDRSTVKYDRRSLSRMG